MANDIHKRVARQELDRHGRDITHVSFSSSGTDNYEDDSFSESTQTVTARVDRPRSPRLVRTPGGEEVEADAKIIVKDSLSITDSGESGRPDEFRSVDGDDYVAIHADDQDNGLITIDCTRK